MELIKAIASLLNMFIGYLLKHFPGVRKSLELLTEFLSNVIVLIWAVNGHTLAILNSKRCKLWYLKKVIISAVVRLHEMNIQQVHISF